MTIVNEAGESSKESLIINRDDFWASTSNKQLNFLQHIFTILKQHGRAAIGQILARASCQVLCSLQVASLLRTWAGLGWPRRAAPLLSPCAMNGRA